MPCLPKRTTREKNSSKIDVPSLISFHITLTHFSLIILFNFIVLYVISMSSFFAWWKLLRRHTPKLLWILSSTTFVNWFTLTFVVVHMYSAVFQFCNDSYILEISDIFVFGAPDQMIANTCSLVVTLNTDIVKSF